MSGRMGPHGGHSKTVIPGVKHIIAIASGKGGVGKSTFVNIASLCQSRTQGYLIDADVHGPSLE